MVKTAKSYGEARMAYRRTGTSFQKPSLRHRLQKWVSTVHPRGATSYLHV